MSLKYFCYYWIVIFCNKIILFLWKYSFELTQNCASKQTSSLMLNMSFNFSYYFMNIWPVTECSTVTVFESAVLFDYVENGSVRDSSEKLFIQRFFRRFHSKSSFFVRFYISNSASGCGKFNFFWEKKKVSSKFYNPNIWRSKVKRTPSSIRCLLRNKKNKKRFLKLWFLIFELYSSISITLGFEPEFIQSLTVNFKVSDRKYLHWNNSNSV